MKKLNLILTSALIIVGSAIGLCLADADKTYALPPSVTSFAACSGASFFGFPSWDSCLPKQNGQPVIKSLNDVWLIAFPLVESLIKAAAYMAAGFIIWGGVKYIKSNGDSGATGAAQKTIKNAIIGLVICLVSVAIVRFIADRF